MPAPYSMMQQVGMVHLPKVYRKAREVIEAHVARPLDGFVRSVRNEFPQGFAEYPALGMIAWDFFRDDYAWINREAPDGAPKVHGDEAILQFWSHSPPHVMHTHSLRGKNQMVKPDDIIERLLR